MLGNIQRLGIAAILMASAIYAPVAKAAPAEETLEEFANKAAGGDLISRTYVLIAGQTLAFAQMASLDKLGGVLYCPSEAEWDLSGQAYAEILRDFVATRDDLKKGSFKKFELALLLALEEKYPCAKYKTEPLNPN
ncbi:hypothetical protein [Rhizobium sp. CCGE532]|uniref:hypothetical protein n=1 Tax=Rhizobium sp. CCGE532 TaxID=2364272 RepID=UPI000EA89897|nr:hypothetical protein [Rhizobium sp. CCGE532]AYG73619.1 hypothetical protein CCGE532_14785 [Rhizobium sp. CCGE532]